MLSLLFVAVLADKPVNVKVTYHMLYSGLLIHHALGPALVLVIALSLLPSLPIWHLVIPTYFEIYSQSQVQNQHNDYLLLQLQA